jgi:hypothetical protein
LPQRLDRIHGLLGRYKHTCTRTLKLVSLFARGLAVTCQWYLCCDIHVPLYCYASCGLCTVGATLV